MNQKTKRAIEGLKQATHEFEEHFQANKDIITEHYALEEAARQKHFKAQETIEMLIEDGTIKEDFEDLTDDIIEVRVKVDPMRVNIFDKRLYGKAPEGAQVPIRE